MARQAQSVALRPIPFLPRRNVYASSAALVRPRFGYRVQLRVSLPVKDPKWLSVAAHFRFWPNADMVLQETIDCLLGLELTIDDRYL